MHARAQMSFLAIPSGTLVSGPADFEKSMQAGRFHHYLIIVTSCRIATSFHTAKLGLNLVRFFF